MSQQLHFTTSNAPLAHALSIVGFKLLTVWNDYTDATLDHLRMPDVKTAKANGRPGTLTYVFERREDLRAALDSWDEMGRALKATPPKASNVVAMAIPPEMAPDAMKIIRATMAGDTHFHALWRDMPARYVQHGKGDPVIVEDASIGAKTVTLPGVKIVSDGLSESDRKKILK